MWLPIIAIASLTLAQPVQIIAPHPSPALVLAQPGHEGHDHAKSNDLIAFLEHHDEFSTLVGLLKQTGVAETLEGKGPFTLFAPTNDAFAKVDEASLDFLTRPDNLEQLKSVLLAHLVKGKILAKDVKEGTPLRTLANTEITVEKHDGVLYLQGIPIHEPDLEVDNGVIHALSGVIMPRP